MFREAGLRIMTATVFGVGPGAGPDLGGVQLERGNRIVGRRRPCLHRCEPHRQLAVSTACQQQRQGTAGPGISCQRQLRRRGRQGEGAVARLRASSYFVIDVSRELTAGRQSPLMSGRAGGNMGGDASWRRSARGDAAKGRR